MNKGGKKVRAHLLISGRVQGVAFRYYAQDIAQNLGVKGWVRNCWDAIVEKVDIEWEKYRGEFNSFGIRG